MKSSAAIPPSGGKLRSAIGVDLLASPPVMVHTFRIRGKLQHKAIGPGAPETASGIPIIGCAGNHESIVRRLRAPYPDRVKARRVFPALLDLSLPFPEAECERLFVDIGPSADGGTTTLAVAARRANLRVLLEKYGQAGFDPLLLDQEALALWTQSLLEIPPPPESQDPKAWLLVIALHQQGRVTFCLGRENRLLATGNLTADIADDVDRRLKALDVPAEHPIEIRWTGSGSDNEPRLNAVRQSIDSRRDNVRHHRHHEPASMLARALTTRAMKPGPLNCNLRSGPLLHPFLRQRALKKSLINAFSALLTGLGLIITAILWQYFASQRSDQMRAAVNRHAIQIIGSPTALRGADAVSQARRRVDDLTAENQPLGDLLSTVVSDRLATLLELAQRHNITIHGLDLQNATMTMDGSASAWQPVSALTRDLERSFGTVTQQRQWDAETGNGQIRFTIRSRP